MNRFFILFFAACTLFSCSKDGNSPEPPIINKTIILNDLKTDEDSVVLTWSKPDSIVKYEILRREDTLTSFKVVGNVFNASVTTYTDHNLPYTPDIEYRVAGYLLNGSIIYSNIKVYKRPDIIILNVQPFDVLCDKQKNWVCLFEKTGRITLYDYGMNKVIKQINTDATIGFSDLATHDGIKELYVPRNDGWIFIYDATSLNKIDQVSTGLESSSVVVNNNQLFVSTQAWTNYPLRVFDRNSKAMLEKTGDFELTRLKKIPGTKTEIVEITQYVGPVDQDYYSFNASGKIIIHRADYYHGDYPLDANIFEMFPDGSKYITSSSGSIFDKTMTFKNTLPKGNDEFSCFEFDATKNLIYGGITEKGIKAYSLQNYQFVKSISTKGYPFRIFEDDGAIICISQTNELAYFNPPASILIEHL